MSRFSRRKAIQVGGLGLLGLTTPKLLRAAEQGGTHPAAKAKSVIFLYQFGGPSHVDTFDLKLDAPDGVRTKFDSIATSMPGLRVCEHLPETAKVMDKVTLIHSVTHTMKNHNSASYYALTGHEPPLDDIRLRDSNDLFPAYGSVVSRFHPGERVHRGERGTSVPRWGGVAGDRGNQGADAPRSPEEIPAFAAFPHVMRDGSITPGQRATFLGKEHDPLLITEDPNEARFQLPELSLPEGISHDRLANRREMQKLVNGQSSLLEFSSEAQGLDAYYERALSMLTSPRVRDAFDLSAEPDTVRERYGRSTYGQSCLLARRLVEAGVTFVNVYFSNSIGGRSKTSGGWDTHGFDDTRAYEIMPVWQLPQTDHTLPVLLNDLDERGLLDETLVVWMGEFGRTPKINGNISRDHWPQCYTVLMAGGGVKRGFRYGESDAHGAYPATNPVKPDDLAATMFHLLGINPQTEMRDSFNRPLPLASGEPIHGIIA